VPKGVERRPRERAWRRRRRAPVSRGGVRLGRRHARSGRPLAGLVEARIDATRVVRLRGLRVLSGLNTVGTEDGW